MKLDLDLRKNAFRILGLDTRAQLPAVLERANELRAYLGIEQVPTYSTDYPVFAPPERTQEAVADAVHRLEDPMTRLVDEATWFQFRDPIDCSAAAALADGNLPQAISLWEAAAAQATDPVIRRHYEHSRAVLHLCGAHIPANVLPPSLGTWERTLTAWTATLTSDIFWRQLVAGSPVGRDPRCHAGAPLDVRSAIGHALACECSRRAAGALRRGGTEEAWAWAAALARNKFPAEFAVSALDEVLEAVAELIRTRTEEVEAALREAGKRPVGAQTGWWSPSLQQAYNPEKAERPPEIESLESRLHVVLSTFERFQSLSSADKPIIQSSRDLIAETYRSLALHYVNHLKDSAKALELVDTATGLATSEGLQIRLRQDARILRWNIAFSAFEAAVKASDYAAAQRAFEALQLHKDPAWESERLDSFREALRNLLIMRGCKPIRREPRPSVIWGFGTRLYGRKDEDPGTGTYLSTQFVVAFLVPILPIARYRVADRGDGTHRFYGKAPLTGAQGVWLGMVLLGVLGGIFALAASGTSRDRAARPPISPPPRIDQSTPEAPPRDLGISRRALGEEIDRRRPLLKAEQAALAGETKNIERERDFLANLQGEIEMRYAGYPRGLPPDVYARYESEVAEYKQRVQAFNARIEAYNARVNAVKREVAELNALVHRYNASR